MENVCQTKENLLHFRDQVAYPQQIRQENQSQNESTEHTRSAEQIHENITL